MSAKPFYDLNKKILDLIYDLTSSKLPHFKITSSHANKYIKNEILILKSLFFLALATLKGKIYLFINIKNIILIVAYIQEKFDAIPIIQPENKNKLVWDFLIIFITFFLFFISPIQLSFNIKTYLLNDFSENSETIQSWVSLTLSILLGTDIFLKFFSAFYEKGLLIENKSLIIKNYWRSSFFSDLLTFLSVLHNALGFNDGSVLLNILNKILQSFIFLKLVEVNKYLCLLEEIIHFGQKGIAFFHLFKLAISIFFFSHIMGCLWHAVCYYGPYDKNILKTTGFYFVNWSSRYLRCLFLTINPGRVDPENELEMAFGYFALLASSGSIGFMISSIQNITRAFNKNEEAKRQV